MRYSIMLQLVSFIALVLVGSAALFAWIQNRTEPRSFTPAQNRLSSSAVYSLEDMTTQQR
jgi:hypothetical protein